MARRRRKKRSTSDSSPAQKEKKVVKQAEVDEIDIQEEEKLPKKSIKLDWKWHVKALAIIYISLGILLFGYIKVLQYYAGKEIAKGKAAIKQVEFIAKSPDKCEEVVDKVLSRQSEIQFFLQKCSEKYQFLDIEKNRTDKNLRDAAGFFMSGKTTFASVVSLLENAISDIGIEKALKVEVQEVIDMGKKNVKSVEKLEDMKNVNTKLSYYDILDFYTPYIIAADNIQKELMNIYSLWDRDTIYDAAARYFRNAISIDNKSYKGYYHLGRVLIDENFYQEGFDNYARSIQVDPDSEYSDTIFVQMRDIIETIKKDKKEEEYKSVHGLLEGLYYLGLCHLNRDEEMKAREYFAEVIKFGKDSYMAFEANNRLLELDGKKEKDLFVPYN